MFFDGVDEGRGLEAVAARVGARFFLDFAGIDGRLDAADDEPGAEALHQVVAEFEGLGEVVAGVDVNERHGDAAGRKGLGREVGHHDAVLAAGEQDGGPVKLGRNFAQHVNGLGFELGQVVEVVSGVTHAWSRFAFVVVSNVVSIVVAVVRKVVFAAQFSVPEPRSLVEVVEHHLGDELQPANLGTRQGVSGDQPPKQDGVHGSDDAPGERLGEVPKA